MTQPPNDPDEPLGGALTPQPDEGGEEAIDYASAQEPPAEAAGETPSPSGYDPSAVPPPPPPPPTGGYSAGGGAYPPPPAQPPASGDSGGSTGGGSALPPPPPSSGAGGFPPPPGGQSAYPPPPPPGQYGQAAPQSGAPQYGAPQYGAPQYGAPQYGAPQYGQGQPGGYPPPGNAFPAAPGYAGAPGLKPHRASTLMILSLLGLLCCFPLAIVSFFLSRSDMKEMDAGRMDPSGRGTTNIARIIAIVAIVLGVLQLIYVGVNWDSITAELNESANA